MQRDISIHRRGSDGLMPLSLSLARQQQSWVLTLASRVFATPSSCSTAVLSSASALALLAAACCFLMSSRAACAPQEAACILSKQQAFTHWLSESLFRQPGTQSAIQNLLYSAFRKERVRVLRGTCRLPAKRTSALSATSCSSGSPVSPAQTLSRLLGYY